MKAIPICNREVQKGTRAISSIRGTWYPLILRHPNPELLTQRATTIC